MRYQILHPDDGKTIGHFEINAFPGCASMCVFNHVYLKPEYRGLGLGKAAHKQRLEMARDLGYDCAICTVKSDNMVETTVLIRAKWKFARHFYNHETANMVSIYTRDLHDPWEEFGTV